LFLFFAAGFGIGIGKRGKIKKKNKRTFSPFFLFLFFAAGFGIGIGKRGKNKKKNKRRLLVGSKARIFP